MIQSSQDVGLPVRRHSGDPQVQWPRAGNARLVRDSINRNRQGGAQYTGSSLRGPTFMSNTSDVTRELVVTAIILVLVWAGSSLFFGSW